MTGVPATTQDQTFWRNWNLYCCDQDHGQPSTSNLMAPTSTPAVSTICADQACDIQAFCCSEAVCPAVDLPLHVEAPDECCVDPHVECFDEDCLGGREVLQATTCDDPACGVEDFACMDEDCRFLQEYVSFKRVAVVLGCLADCRASSTLAVMLRRPSHDSQYTCPTQCPSILS
jgi:hypothetical protein